jgi:predicted anti-sigma-YlaC factor YlaD
VAGPGTDDPHVREALGLDLLGALTGDERDRVERHLARCADCCIEADALGAAVEPLALVPPQHVRHLMAEFGVPVEEPRTDARTIASGPT